MKITNLNYDDFKSNSYLINIDEAFYLVDPSIELNVLLKQTNRLDGILITHGHIDHILYLKEIYEFFKCPVYCHKEAKIKIEDNVLNCSKIFGVDKDLKIDKYNIINDGDIIDGYFKVIFTPGHTNCSVIYLYNGIMFSGDTLFFGSVGRTDLYTGSSSTLLKTLKMIKGFKTNYKIYPGHDIETTLVEEKKNNPFLVE